MTFCFFVGIDWASESHRVCVLNSAGCVITQFNVEHNGRGLAIAVDHLRRLMVHSQQVAVAIEVSWGTIVDTLVDSGFAVFAINPKQLDRFRDRYTVAGAKDDSRDALVLASALRTDVRSFRRVQVDDPEIIRLRQLSRIDDQLKDDLRRTSNQLWEQLHRYYPQILQLSSGADEPFVWGLLEKAPTPTIAARLRPATVRSILSKYRITRMTVPEVIAILRTEPLHVAPGSAEACAEHILLLIPRLFLLHAQLRDVARRMKALLADLCSAPNECEHHDAEIMMSLPGLGIGVAAVLLAEASGPIRDSRLRRVAVTCRNVTRHTPKRKAPCGRDATSVQSPRPERGLPLVDAKHDV